MIKLFQKKADRDWLFLYLMSFFEVLLAAGMSISPLYLAIIDFVSFWYRFWRLLRLKSEKLRGRVNENTDKVI